MESEGMILGILTSVLRATRLPAHELQDEYRKELALALYRRGVLSVGKARLLTQMTRWGFEDLLGERKISRHYAEADLEEDIQYGLGHH